VFLQGDGNLITWEGTPKNRNSLVWKSNSPSATSTPYFLGLDCDRENIGIYRGSPDNPGSTIWSERTGLPPGPPPTLEPLPPTPTGPAPTSASCTPLYLGLKDNEVIQDGQSLQSPDDSNVLVEQWTNANLAVIDNGRVIWDSGQSESQGDYWTKLQVSKLSVDE